MLGRILILALIAGAAYMFWRKTEASRLRNAFGQKISDAKLCPQCGVHSVKGAVNCDRADCPLR